MSRAYAEYKKTHPNAKKETILKALSPEYKDGRTKQAFKDATDINKILVKAAKTGAVNHLSRYQPEYGDFTDMPDLLEAHQRLERANQIFNELPGEIKREFGQSPEAFFAFANDPANIDKLKQMLPEVAELGDSDLVQRTGPRAPMATVEPEVEPEAPDGDAVA